MQPLKHVLVLKNPTIRKPGQVLKYFSPYFFCSQNFSNKKIYFKSQIRDEHAWYLHVESLRFSRIIQGYMYAPPQKLHAFLGHFRTKYAQNRPQKHIRI